MYKSGNPESPIEEEFWRALYPHEKRQDFCQVEIDRFRVDSLFVCGDRKVVVELDGKEWHQPYRDAIRDNILLGFVDEIIRIPGGAIWYNPVACIEVLGEWNQFFVGPYHKQNLHCVEWDSEYRLVKDECDESGDSIRDQLYKFDFLQAYRLIDKWTAAVGNGEAFFQRCVDPLHVTTHISKITRRIRGDNK